MEPWREDRYKRPDPVDYFYHKLRLWDRFWRGFGCTERPGLKGHRVLDIGCGYGAFVVRAALDGAQATGIDIDGGKLRIGAVQAEKMLHDPTRALFYNADAAELSTPEGFDVMITYETLEHIDNLQDVLANLYRLMNPGGVFYVSWGGLWPSVFGGHYWLQKHFMGLEIPWSHRLFTKPDERPGVNQLAYEDYVDIITTSPWGVESWATNVGNHPGYRVFRALARLPGLRDSFTQNVYAVLRKAI